MESPSKLLLGLEAARGFYEFGLGMLLNSHLRRTLPHGDGHAVMVIPGLGASDDSTQYLRNLLNDIGYKAHTWGLGRNLGPRHGMEKLLTSLTDQVDSIVSESPGNQISIIGWSLGGIYSREIAKLRPESVRQVITLGSPFKSANGGTNAAKMYEFLSKDSSHKDPSVLQRIAMPPPVPFTSLYSKTDGVVHWACSIEEIGDFYQNVEVYNSSHLGLGHHPASMSIIADRLQYSKNNWRPYAKSV